MICPHCGNEARGRDRVCEFCGALLPAKEEATGAAAIRQGRGREGDMPLPGQARPSQKLYRTEKYTSDAGKPALQRGPNRKAAYGYTRPLRRQRERVKPVQRHAVNWAAVWTALIALTLVLCAGAYLYLKNTDGGQLLLARMGRDANATALWTLGREELDKGNVSEATRLFEEAYAKEPEREDLYARLSDLAEAYEAQQRNADAEKIYVLQYTEVDKTKVSAYSNLVRILLEQSRLPEAVEIMRAAYENTGDTTFASRREQLVPLPPTATLAAGSYKENKQSELVSSQGYDIYYSFGEGELPETGTLYETPFSLTEGTTVIRAVCVSNDLVSDVMTIKYTVSMPTPMAPKSNIKSGEYNSLKVSLRIVDEDKNVTLYYTIDGTAPTLDSPIYDGTPIKLPGGRITLRAVAVNQYGKVSNELNVIYDIKQKFKSYYRDEKDPFGEFTLLSTTYENFVKKFGAPKSEETFKDESAVKGTCTRALYDWGEARFVMTSGGNVLYYIDSTAKTGLTLPRKLKMGMSQSEITSLFRDMGQLSNQSGSRSLYYDKAVGSGYYYPNSEEGEKIVYVCQRESGGTATLTLYLSEGALARVKLSYVSA